MINGNMDLFSWTQFVGMIALCMITVGVLIYGALLFKQDIIDRYYNKNKPYNKPNEKPLQKVK